MFVALMVNMVRPRRSVAVPLITPVDTSKVRPPGSSGVMVHETMSPEPVSVGERGKLALAVFLVKLRSSGV